MQTPTTEHDEIATDPELPIPAPTGEPEATSEPEQEPEPETAPDPLSAAEERIDRLTEQLGELRTYTSGLVHNLTFAAGQIANLQQAVELLTALQPGAPAPAPPGKVVVSPTLSIPRRPTPGAARAVGPRPLRPLAAAPNASGRKVPGVAGPRSLPPVRPAPNAPMLPSGRPRPTLLARQASQDELDAAIAEAGGVVDESQISIDVTGLAPGEHVFPGRGPGGSDLVVNVRRPTVAPANGARVQR